MKRTLTAAAALIALAPQLHADPILGSWLSSKGTPIEISTCGNMYCVTWAGGDFDGAQFGTFTAKDDGYAGDMTQMSTGSKYKGTARIDGNKLLLTAKKFGISIGTRTWTRP